MPQSYRNVSVIKFHQVDPNSPLLRSVLGGRACIAFSTDNISSTHAELLPDSWHISIKSSATCNCVQELEQIAVWFSSCSCGSAAAGTASSWFKASPGMWMWPALGELTGRHDLLPAPDYTAASRSPWALCWFTSVLSPFFFSCLSSSYILFFFNRSVLTHPCILLLHLLAFHYIIVLCSFQFAGIQTCLIKSFSPDIIISGCLPNFFECIIVKCIY